jgi:hypothetical protein
VTLGPTIGFILQLAEAFSYFCTRLLLRMFESARSQLDLPQ